MFVKIFQFLRNIFGAKYIFYPINTEFDQKLKFIPDFNRISSVFSKFIKFKTEIRFKLFARFLPPNLKNDFNRTPGTRNII
jgi:hypothetical protein